VYRPPAHAYVPALFSRYVRWISDEFPMEINGSKVEAAILKAIVAHLYFVWIHPYGDGNGRAARLIEFAMLWHGGINTAAAHLLSNHYNRTRLQYYERLTGGQTEIFGFILYALEGFVNGLEEQFNATNDQHRKHLWKSLVDSTLDDHRGQARDRRLLIATSLLDIPKSIEQLRIEIPRLDVLYEHKGPKTVSRDINALVKLGLIVKTDDGLVARWKEHLLSYLPGRKT
jgi:Fic family protein